MLKFKFAFVNEFKKPISVQQHIHSCYELIYYYRASGYSEYQPNYNYYLEDFKNIEYINSTKTSETKNEFEFANNSFIIYPPNTLHNEIHNKKASLIAIGFELNESEIKLEPGYYLDEDFFFFNLLEKISEELNNKVEYYDRMIEAILNSFIIHLKRLGNKNVDKSNSLFYAKSYLKEYFSTDIDLNKLAKSCNYSLEHFRTLFKGYTGLSPKAYILHLRLKHAIKLLTTTNIPLNVVSIMCGYDDYPQFSTFFKKRTKYSPYDFRLLNSKNN